jgi:UDP-GlcNAc:undecaprenyl-phosphate/decaprenyl-phosphate GlcNAc-1-phosphate transferase
MLIVAILVYFRIADRYNIIDKPNERSSHSNITIRGGGIIFPLAALLWFVFFGFGEIWAISGLLMIAVISFLDDLKPQSGRVRMAVQFVAVGLLFYGAGLFQLHFYWLFLAFLVGVFWINAFNFMDGINAITPFYSLALLGTFWFLNREIHFFDNDLIVVLGISLLIFSYFNARKRAKAFAGDVGSVCMAFLLWWMMLALILQTGRFEFILLFAVYGLDSVFTILFRLFRRENIFQAHRSHLYQVAFQRNEMAACAGCCDLCSCPTAH